MSDKIIKDYDLLFRCSFCGDCHPISSMPVIVWGDLTLYLCTSCYDSRFTSQRSDQELMFTISQDDVVVNGIRLTVLCPTEGGIRKLISWAEYRRDGWNNRLKLLRSKPGKVVWCVDCPDGECAWRDTSNGYCSGDKNKGGI